MKHVWQADRPAFLASVMSAGEADIARSAGADIIDCKNPLAGSLGALPHDVVAAIVARVGGIARISATVGDLREPDEIVEAAEAMARTGVDYVKVGIFDASTAREVIERLQGANLGRARLVAVLMADLVPDFSLLHALADSGFAVVMLDTADKDAGPLTKVLSRRRIGEFVEIARAHGLASGLAGSLRLDDIAELSALSPDVLGFRGQLCAKGRRSAVEANQVAAVRAAIDQTAELRSRSVA